MAKVRNIGNDYTGTLAEVRAGAVAEVSEEAARYLLSAECPGKFERVVEEAPAAKPSGKGARGKA